MNTYTLIARWKGFKGFETTVFECLSFEEALKKFDEHTNTKSTQWVKILSDENGETRRSFKR